MSGAKRIALEVNGTFTHRNGDDPQRIKVLSTHFDAVIVVTEAEIKRATNLAAYLWQRLQ